MNSFKRSVAVLIVLVTSLPLQVTAQGQIIDAAVKRFTAQITDIRHNIHENPELGNREFKTAELVASHLKELGIDVQTGVAHTGVVGVLVGGRPGPVVAVRADMDALPVTEDTNLPFKSTETTTYLGKEVGVMHACGHDIHTAVQLGVASVLSSMRDNLPGTVKFIFQPAEEGPPPGEQGGAELMVDEGVMEDPRPTAVFGLHTLSDLEVDKVGFTVGPALAAVDQFIVKIRGKQAHGAAPHKSVDPIVMASQVVTAFQTIRARTLSPLEPSVITVGIFRGGERFNIIPAQVHLEGTVRTYNPDVRDTIERRMGEILDGITSAYGGTYTLDYDRGTPATINDPALAEKMMPTMEHIVGRDNVIMLDPTMGGEDFAYYANITPGFFFRLGQVKSGTTSGGHHTPTFRADDACIPVGMKVMSNLLMNYLKSGGLN